MPSTSLTLHGRRLLEADLRTAEIMRVTRLPIGPIHPAVGAGAIWSSSAAVWENTSAQDDRVVRIDPATSRVVETLHLGGNVHGVAFGFKSVWASVPTRTGEVVRITP